MVKYFSITYNTSILQLLMDVKFKNNNLFFPQILGSEKTLSILGKAHFPSLKWRKKISKKNKGEIRDSEKTGRAK